MSCERDDLGATISAWPVDIRLLRLGRPQRGSFALCKISYLEIAGPNREVELDGTAGLAEADKILGH